MAVSSPAYSVRRKAGAAHRDHSPGDSHSDYAGQYGEHDTRRDVHTGGAVLAVLEQPDRLIAERRERGVAAAESRREKEPHLGTERRRVEPQAHEESQQQRTRDVDDEGSQRERRRGAILDESAEQVACNAAERATG